MPNPTWTCCATLPPCPVCPESCDFDTSYTFDGFMLQFTFSSDFGTCPKCVYEGGGGGGDYYQKSYSIDVTVTQLAPAVMTRSGSEGDCCYQACGTFEIEWEITDDVTYGCCQPEDVSSSTPAVECTGGQTIAGVAAVPYRYEIFCRETPIDGCPSDSKLGAQWLHRITLCAVKVATSHKGYVADCNYNPTDVDCGEEPRGALLMSGAIIEWYTPLVDLATLVTADYNRVSLWSCSTLDDGCTNSEECPTDPDPHDQTFGPFSVGVMPDGCTYDDDDCALSVGCAVTHNVYPTNMLGVGSVNPDCDPFDPSRLTGSVCPCGNWSYACGCRRIDAGTNYVFPTFV